MCVRVGCVSEYVCVSGCVCVSEYVCAWVGEWLYVCEKNVIIIICVSAHVWTAYVWSV